MQKVLIDDTQAIQNNHLSRMLFETINCSI